MYRLFNEYRLGLKPGSMLLASVALAMIFFAGCRSAVVFESPNSLRNISGTLFLNNGKSVKGKLIINTEGTFNNSVKVIPEGERETMRIPLADVQGYEARMSYYALKEIRSGLGIGRDIRFMKRLTPEESRIHLFENMERRTSTDRNNVTQTHYDNNYFLQLPGEKQIEVWALSSSKFTPNFDEKMSKIVADCPSLAKKIAEQQEGYFYRQVTVFSEKRADVLLNIISEYNKCK